MRFRHRALAVVLVAAFIPLASPAQTSVTMDGVLSAPFIADLEASPDGGTVAYIVHERGTHAVYALHIGQSARRVVNYAMDDGHSIGWLQVARGGGAVAYVRGGGPNRDGEIANPTSALKAPKEQIWVANVSGGAPVLVGDGSGPQFSPSANQLMWMGHDGLMLTPLTWKNGNVTVGRSRSPFEIRGNVRAPRFSPDGSKIAFENDRGDHAFVTIFDTVAHKLTYASPSFRSDISPAWSPDGRSVAFLRLPAPFSIWVANATTGAARQVWQADAGMGSEFYGLDSSNQLFWSKDGRRIAFAWEKNGWRNLWTVPATGGTAVDVTPGQFEVESALTSLDRSRLVYATNEGDIDLRHIWTVGFEAANPTALTHGSESQWFPTPLARGRLAYVNAGWSDAPQVMVAAANARAVSVGPHIPASFPAAAMVRPQLVTFAAADGLQIHGQLFVPTDGNAKHCGVIFVHGGSERQMLPGFHYMEAYANLYETNQYIVNHGCEVLSVNYRSGVMYGHAFRTAAGVGPRGASEYQDVIAGARFLQARPEVDPDRIGIYGLSYGGYETAMALARNSDIFKAGFDMAGVHDWATINGSGRAAGAQGEHGTAYEASPVASISTWKSPVFLAQGDDDRNVPFSQGVEMDRALRAQGVDVTEMVFPNETHEMTLVYADELRLYSAGIGFLLNHLGGTP